MLTTKLYIDETEVHDRLAPFGVTLGEMMEVAQLTHGARSDAVPSDPVNAPGLLSYIYGTRYMRRAFCRRGWLEDRHENVEAVRHAEHDTRVVFQNVDLACSRFHSPKAISGKGNAAERMVDAAQGSLFHLAEAPEVVDLPRLEELNGSVWYFCMSFEGDTFRAELSLPATIAGRNFKGFFERIFIIDSSTEVGGGSLPLSSEGPVEVEPIVSRKK